MEAKKENSTTKIKEVRALVDGKKPEELLAAVKRGRQSVDSIIKSIGEKEQAIKARREAEQRLAAEAALEAERKAEEERLKAEAAALEAEKSAKAEAENAAEPARSEAPARSEKPNAPEAQAEAQAEPQAQAQAPAQSQSQPLPNAAKAAKPPRREPQRKEFVPSENRRKEYVPNANPQVGRQYGGAKPQQGGAQRPAQGQGQGQGQRAARPQQGSGSARPQGARQAPQPVAFVPKDGGKSFGGKRKSGDRNYDDKRSLNKKQLSRGNVSIEDFDEDKSGYRKLRTKKTAKAKEESRIKIDRAVINKEIIPLKELSEKIGISAVEITKILFKEGIIKTINDSIDYDTAGFVAASIGVELELKLDKTAEEVLTEGFSDDTGDSADYVTRPPVVTVMGHVDHGKTSLLDRIRSTNVTAGEAGGITQHIGAYSVSVRGGSKITFVDTPGHAAFTAMRARGAQVTDIAVIVIAADDGIMPQTIEAINHAKAAGVSIIIAANKIDKPQANIERVRQQLTEQDIVVEDWGGDVILVPVSAKTGEGIDKLLDSILLTAEMRELKANPNRNAKAAVVEAKLDKGKGPVATVIIQNGTLKLGDNVVSGTIVGKVRAMFDDSGRNVKEAGPSMAVSILGLEAVPNAGDILFAVEQEKLMKLVAEERRNKEREEMIRRQQKVSLDELFSKISGGDLKRLNLIIKADVQGSVEAVKQSLEELSDENVKISVIHAAVGAINETDVMLADSSNSIIIGFNVRPDAGAKALAERSKIDIKLYRIIYEAIDDVKKAMKGMLEPKFKDIYMGKAEVRETFKITGVGTVAGCYVTEGKIVRGGKLRIYRDDVMICEGNVLQLKRFKDDVKEVQQGFECGISIENFNDVKIGDFIESYVVEEEKR